jgi:hypothetical protein
MFYIPMMRNILPLVGAVPAKGELCCYVYAFAHLKNSTHN